MTNPGIVLCSRVRSRRVPNKPLTDFVGKPAIWHLANRLLQTGYPVCLATPMDQEDQVLHKVTADLNLKRFLGHPQDVLSRFMWAAIENNFDPVIRVTHDDLFPDMPMMKDMVTGHISNGMDYSYMAGGLRGTDCEVISLSLVEKAEIRYGGKNLEYLSYAFRHVDPKAKINAYDPTQHMNVSGRLSLDWPEDVDLIHMIFELLGPAFSNNELYALIRKAPTLLKFNAMPTVTVYTCVYNAEQSIHRAIQSVLNQDYPDMEYVIVDDWSTDQTAKSLLEYADHPKVRIIRNPQNVGLASSCNVALKAARGSYYLRLDADDELLPDSISRLTEQMKANPHIGAIYPAYYQDGNIHDNTEYHMGGTMLRASVYHELKFCDGLRHFEGREFYRRLTDQFKVMAYDNPTWVYHATDGSLSRTDSKERRKWREWFLPWDMEHRI